jgi:hypothetical protein
MAWREIGTVSITASNFHVRVGVVDLPANGTLEVRIKQLSPSVTSLFRAGLLYVTTGVGRTLGTRKFWGHLEGEDYVLGGPGFSSTAGSGILWIEPRTLNLRALRSPALSPWTLQVWADEPSTLPADRFESPGFIQSTTDRLLRLMRVGRQGRISF